MVLNFPFAITSHPHSLHFPHCSQVDMLPVQSSEWDMLSLASRFLHVTFPWNIFSSHQLVATCSFLGLSLNVTSVFLNPYNPDLRLQNSYIITLIKRCYNFLYTCPSLPLDQGLANFFCRGTDCKYFRLFHHMSSVTTN